MLAERYHWTPEQICRMDPDYIAELLVRISAEADVLEARRKAAERERKRRERRARRLRSVQRGGSRIEDADISEIT